MYVFFNEEDLHADHDLDEESGKKDREAEELRFVVHQMLACTFCVCVCVCVCCGVCVCCVRVHVNPQYFIPAFECFSWHITHAQLKLCVPVFAWVWVCLVFFVTVYMGVHVYTAALRIKFLF